MEVEEDGFEGLDQILNDQQSFIKNRKSSNQILHLIKRIKNANTSIKLLQPLVFKLFF